MFNSNNIETQHKVEVKRSAFTLIELLVVIAIIAILAAILFPVFARARENARRSSCQSNMKQMGLGILQYSQDYDENIPRNWVNGYNGDPVGIKWMDVIQPYVKSTQLFNCPSDSVGKPYRTAPLANFPLTTPTKRGADELGSYGWNSAYWNGGSGLSGLADQKTLAQIDAVATTINVLEVVPNIGGGASNNASVDWPDIGAQPTINKNVTPPRLGGAVARHLDTINVLFCDGHVKSLNIDALGAKATGTINNGALKLFTTQDD